MGYAFLQKVRELVLSSLVPAHVIHLAPVFYTTIACACKLALLLLIAHLLF